MKPPKRRKDVPKKTGLTFGAPKERGQRIGIYGPGGIGKTTLAMNLPGDIVFFDFDESLALLEIPKNVKVAQGVNDFQDFVDAIEDPENFVEFNNIVIDSLTKVEELATEWVLKNVPHDKGNQVKRIEDYGYGKGYQHIYETMVSLFSKLDALARAGINIVLVAHDCTANVPNPDGEDWIRYEPRLYASNSGKSNTRLRFKEWVDHLLFVGYDVAVKDKKGKGSGSRTIYPNELPHCMAKSRKLDELYRFDSSDFNEIWKELF